MTGTGKTIRHLNHERALEALGRRNRIRVLSRRAGADFASNDYLGLASSDLLRQAASAALARGVAIGSGGSRLLRGNDPEHEALETEAAAYFGAEAALYYGGGFIANAALLETLPQREDVIIYDELVHASAHTGIAASRAQSHAFRHNDAQACEDAVVAWRRGGGIGRPWIVVESLYSMDGDCAPLADLAAIAARQEGMLVIDEAHATGALGPRGRGLAAHLEGRGDVVTLHTCGKALGAMGGLVCGPKVLMDYLVNRSRAFIYATAPSPLMAAVVRAALIFSAFAEQERADLARRVRTVGERLSSACGVVPSGTHIQPVIVRRDSAAVSVAHALQKAGYDVRAIRPPTVPEGSARLRISITLNPDEATALAMVDDLAHILRREGIDAAGKIA